MKINLKQLLLLKKEGLAPEDIEVKIYDRMIPFHLEKGSYIRKDKWLKNNLLDMVTCDGFNIDEKCILVPEDSSAADELLDIIDEEKDSLRFYYLGNNWQRKVEHIGAKSTYNHEGVIII